MTIKKRTGTPADSEAGSEAGSWQGVDDRTLTLSRVLVNLEEHFDLNEATSGTDPASDPAAPKQITDVLAPQIRQELRLRINSLNLLTTAAQTEVPHPHPSTVSTNPHTSHPLFLSPKSPPFVLCAQTVTIQFTRMFNLQK